MILMVGVIADIYLASTVSGVFQPVNQSCDATTDFSLFLYSRVRAYSNHENDKGIKALKRTVIVGARRRA